MVKPVRMVLVGGADRSGSTLVSLLLGAAPGAFAVGETMSVWGDGVLHNRPCSCGAPFRDCPFWIRVGNDAFGGWDEAEAWRLKRAQRGGVRGMRRIARARLVGERGAPELTDLAEARERLYRSIASVSGSNVIIESSKNPYFSYQLSRLVGCEARMVHLIRDPRGTVFSWQRTKFAPHPLPEAARSWVRLNGWTEAAWLLRGRRLRVKYEALASRPEVEVRRLLGFAGLPATPVADLLRDHEHHLIRGNPIRFDRGERTIELDDEWRRAMPRRDKLRVTWRTLPLFIAYGYPPWDSLCDGAGGHGAERDGPRG